MSVRATIRVATRLLPVAIGLLATLPHTGAAQSRLPPCPADQDVRWDGCYGTYTYPDGTKYVGEFRDDKKNGQGTYTFPNGAKYVGEFRDGNRNGQGIYTFPSGNKYVGDFRDDEPNGQGSKFSPDGRLIQNGIWLNGDFVQANNLPNPVLTAQRP